MLPSIPNFISALYIVPTPIGNLQDITCRALSVLRQVDCIAAENTRRTRILLDFFSIHTSLYILHQYNEYKRIPMLISKLQGGLSIALVSDAGTPLINDPGYCLVQSCQKLKIRVIPLPGPCAAITALCGSGLPSDRFCFEGFLPHKHKLRIDRLRDLSEESRTLIFYDVKHRIIDTLKDMVSVFGLDRYVVLARELTKIWESIYGAPVGQLLSWVQKDHSRIQGEIVLVVAGNCLKKNELSPKILQVMRLLASELPVKRAAILAGYIYGVKKNMLYKKYLDEKLNKINDQMSLVDDIA
ncbi:16S rRNA (cytidine(1402)-2'-O)-methyltransferase [Blochmannia endosymbiont of Camponotus modoc]|uniref:16S rRNA (cytidine(1402)-2'-O)-methyltransferase n=1 Tax=Blochmannia endosymbiont of Camponotus modoc TaxID=2945587 RepID=UPI002024DB2B|nr:16S rRNA (cytidine(1402)-2'-O)-methyltransferase [Blochmannia endosymbiont of Camponotus modoc]URJ29636.1 16S rRNA (cytidine(1402)-2'-O)-methyltransferase [Blochmannia endosymbiont of Camponotus modoc]